MKESILKEGFFLAKGLISNNLVMDLRSELMFAINKETEFHKTINHQDHGMVLLCVKYGGSFLKLFDIPELMAPFNEILGDGCIVYANSSSSLPPNSGNFSSKIHVDSPRIIKEYKTTLMSLILLDDFTEENGATFYLPGSHCRVDPPGQQEFYQKAKRLVAPSGSVFFWDPRIWHSGGINHTGYWRHAITIVMCRSFMKQRLDIPKILEVADVEVTSDAARQKLGFNCRVPESYEEYYAPLHLRKFKQKSE